MNKMKKILTYITLPVFLVILTACGNSSDALQREWKAQTGAQKNVVLKFDKDKVTVDGKEYDYKQKSVEKKGDITYYKIEQNGENYTVIFPDKDKNIAVMIQPYSSKDDLNGTMLYAMNKKEQPNYSEYSKKYSQ